MPACHLPRPDYSLILRDRAKAGTDTQTSIGTRAFCSTKNTCVLLLCWTTCFVSDQAWCGSPQYDNCATDSSTQK